MRRCVRQVAKKWKSLAAPSLAARDYSAPRQRLALPTRSIQPRRLSRVDRKSPFVLLDGSSEVPSREQQGRQDTVRLHGPGLELHSQDGLTFALRHAALGIQRRCQI